MLYRVKGPKKIEINFAQVLGRHSAEELQE